MHRYRSDRLQEDIIRQAIEATAVFLQEALGEALITATYEFGCNLHDDLLYRSMKVGTSWLDRFVRQSLDQRIVVPGGSDFRLVVEGERLEVLFCHEGDIHLAGREAALLDGLRAAPAYEGINFEAVPDEQD
jgi:hypothetical protein